MVNTSRLKGAIVERETTQESLAVEIGMNRTTFYRKMKDGGKSFTIGEVQRIVKALKLSNEEAIFIFFNDEVA